MLQHYFPEHFRCNLKIYEHFFFHSSLYRVFELKNVRLPFSTKYSLTWGVKCEELNFRKS